MNLRVSHMGFVVDNVVVVKGCFHEFQFSTVNYSITKAQNSSVNRAGTMDQSEALTPLLETKTVYRPILLVLHVTLAQHSTAHRRKVIFG